MEEKSIDETLIRMKAGKFVGLLASIVIGTNSMTMVYQKIHQNEEKANYDRDRAQRYADGKLEEAKAHHEMEALKIELKHCKNKE